jgi:hypothetical protein
MAAQRLAARWWHRPLWLLFVIGCGLSATATGRFTVRLILDGMLSFAFVPAISIALLAAIGRPPRNRVTFAQAIDLFFAGYAGWLVWMVAVAAVALALPPRGLGPWLVPVELSMSLPIVWSVIADFRFFRDTAGRRPRAAAGAVLAHRLIGWTAFVAYFEGRAAWSILQPAVAGWFGA